MAAPAPPPVPAEPSQAGEAPAPPPRSDAQPGPEGRTAPAVLLSRYGRAAYPRDCHVRGEEGTVVLDVEVGPDGKPGAVAIVASSGNARLDAAAVEALRKAAFAPATRGGKPVASVHRVRWVWRLVDDE